MKKDEEISKAKKAIVDQLIKLATDNTTFKVRKKLAKDFWLLDDLDQKINKKRKSKKTIKRYNWVVTIVYRNNSDTYTMVTGSVKGINREEALGKCLMMETDLGLPVLKTCIYVKKTNSASFKKSLNQ